MKQSIVGRCGVVANGVGWCKVALYVVYCCGWWRWVVKVVMLEGMLYCGVLSDDAVMCRMVLLWLNIVWWCVLLRVGALVVRLGEWPWTCRSRSRRTIFAVAPFDGKSIDFLSDGDSNVCFISHRLQDIHKSRKCQDLYPVYFYIKIYWVYFRWCILSGIFCVAYFVWYILSGIYCPVYFVQVHFVRYILPVYFVRVHFVRAYLVRYILSRYILYGFILSGYLLTLHSTVSKRW